MNDIIQLLPDSVANQIAAGEVIQRPASVIKELMENAVDAGAKHIDVNVVDAGRTMIQVVDDGKGMSETDARLAFERHATSKIRKAEDLFALHTMGFRGEALASIAAVAQVDLQTRQPSEEVGTHLTISGGKFSEQEACACPVGSNFKVENLFFNVPARRRFLKSNTTELNNIITAFERIVLVYPDIAFTLHSNESELFNLSTGSLRQRVSDVFGRKFNQELIPVDVDTTLCKITGFVGKVESAHKKGVRQFFFVNGRYMKHAYFNKAVQSAYERLLPAGEQVPYFIYFTVDPEEIDVNIHPTKTEIKFQNELPVWEILAAAVKEAIGVYNDVPAIDFDVQGKPNIPVFNQNPSADMGNIHTPKVDYNPQYNPFHAPASKTAPSHWEDLYAGLKPAEEPQTEDIFETSSASNPSIIEEKSPVHYQYKGRYVMTAVKSGLMIIDQHRAHVRILYDQYEAQLSTHSMTAQKVLFPDTLQLSRQEQLALQQIMPQLTQMGFEIVSAGDTSYTVNAVPAGMDDVNVADLLHDILYSAQQQEGRLSSDITHLLALDMARHAAIPYGQVLSNEEMESLVNDLFSCTNVNYTPDGKNILCILKQQEIENLLG